MGTMKNTKPSYATNLGTGVFMGTEWITWQCTKCGCQRQRPAPSKPSPTDGGTRCPGSKTGNHIWKKM